MSVLLELSVFSLGGDESKTKEVAKVIKTLQDNGYKANLNPMGTVIESENIEQALNAIKISHDCMDKDRFYMLAKFDCKPNVKNMLDGRVDKVLKAVENIK